MEFSVFEIARPVVDVRRGKQRIDVGHELGRCRIKQANKQTTSSRKFSKPVESRILTSTLEQRGVFTEDE